MRRLIGVLMVILSIYMGMIMMAYEPVPLDVPKEEHELYCVEYPDARECDNAPPTMIYLVTGLLVLGIGLAVFPRRALSN